MNSSGSQIDISRITIRIVRWFYILSPVVCVPISLLLIKFYSKTLSSVFESSSFSKIQEALWGTTIGLLLAFGCGICILKLRYLNKLRSMITEVFVNLKPKWFDLVFTSISAGFSEELLFRGAIQPALGIWITAFVFSVAHGLGPRSRGGLLLFGVFIFVLGIVFGTVSNKFGLTTAMFAHGSLDLGVLFAYKIFLSPPILKNISGPIGK